MYDTLNQATFPFPFYFNSIFNLIGAWPRVSLRLNPLFSFSFPPYSIYRIRKKKTRKEGKERLVTNIWFYLDSSSPLSIWITRMKKKEMSTHQGINDWFLSINLLKTRTIEYLVPGPRKDMFLDLALKILLLFFVFHIVIHYGKRCICS